MKYMGKYFLLAGMLVAAAGLPLRAQVTYLAPSNGLVSSPPSSPETSPDDSIITIKKRVDEVNVLFIATDKRGKFVRNLNEKDFAILDDHKPPQSIVNFRRETDLPIQLGLLVDTSGAWTV
jgi:Ca-activated chloride channel homolog